jgi:2-methylisocitrate lyase-like PEP mutase family enzyme
MPSRAETLRALHRGPGLLVLPNAWDVASARLLAALPGCRALATTSGGVARSIGFEDGQAPGEEMLRVAARIAAAVEVPVSADLESGYGDPVATARTAFEAGIAGINLEDSRGGALVTLDEQVEVLRAVRAAVPELVVNARVDVFLHGDGDVNEAVERANAYLDAGADCTFPIFAPAAALPELAARTNGPVNALAAPEADLAELARIGVRRVTYGSGLAKVALAAAEEAARAALSAA